MIIKFPEIYQKNLDYAVSCLEDCKQENALEYGFNYPYFTPGGGYGAQWWQLDSTVALGGYKWIDREFSERSLLNFVESQKEDGRICLWGRDLLPKAVAGGDFPKQSEGVSSLPKLFDVAYHILKGSTDIEYKKLIYSCMKKYLAWWFENRLDKKTGLISAVFEETFIPYLGFAGEYAPVDTNTEVYVGCHYTELIAEELGYVRDAEVINSRKSALKESINKYLWNDEKGAYYPYLIKEEKLSDCLMASTFFPLRLNIADEERKNRLIKLLLNHDEFNWDTIPVTSVSKLDKVFTTTKGNYQGNLSWSGNVWTLINEMIVRGLNDCGEYKLAAELALKTVYAFNNNCTEFINPFDGTGHGVLKYAWTASQYLQLITETIFGISYDAKKFQIDVFPKLTDNLKQKHIELKNVEIQKGIYLDVIIDCGEISCFVSNKNIKINIKAV